MYNKFTEYFDNTHILKTDNQMYNNIREKYKLNEYEDDLTNDLMKIKKLTNRYYNRGLFSPYSIKFMNQRKQSRISEQFDEIIETM